MKLIAHRGLVNGPNKNLENQPYQIQTVLNDGHDCEIDLWTFDGKLYLGHDGPQYSITEDFIEQSGLWIHAKNLEALAYCQSKAPLNYFWHENDAYTLTSKGYIWAYPGKPLTDRSIMVLPEWEDATLNNVNGANCYGVCTDFVALLT